MKIVVTDRHGSMDTYDSEKWVIDDEDRLHVVASGGGNLASYNRGAWESVRRTESDADQMAAAVADRTNLSRGRR